MTLENQKSSRPVEHVALPFGALDRASTYAPFSEDAAKLRSATPVFVTSIETEVVDRLKGLALFRMGGIEVDGCAVVTARIQKGSAQFVWLADATDPDFWSALDTMRKTGRAGFVFINGEDTWFMQYKIEQPGTAIDRYRRQLGRKDVKFLEAAGSLITDGSMKQMASSIIPGLTVEHLQINILATRRVRAAAEALGGMFVRKSSDTASFAASIVSAPRTVQ
ncbi:hypothetical protein [Paraburkholderia sp. D1E]|uniref:hypothetical protein n=1 Tax=Paraburkholderia sp. D1E TaxID=3461398 RepID=UPI0040461AE0